MLSRAAQDFQSHVQSNSVEIKCVFPERFRRHNLGWRKNSRIFLFCVDFLYGKSHKCLNLSLQEVETFKTFLENLNSENNSDLYDATNKVKNLIIGSNRQKRYIIEQGYLPRLIELLQDEKRPLHLRINVAIIIGSLARLERNVQELDERGTEDILLQLILLPTSDPKMVEICLSVLKTVMQNPAKIRNSFFQHSEDINTLSRLIRKFNVIYLLLFIFTFIHKIYVSL